MVTVPALKLDLHEFVKEDTGVYDVGFFNPPSSEVHLSDARIGLDLFLNEARQALSKGGLTDAQRKHILRIAEYARACSIVTTWSAPRSSPATPVDVRSCRAGSPRQETVA